MAHNLQLIADAVGEIAQTITGIANVVTKPVVTVGRTLPAIFVVYEGFRQKPMTFGPTWKMTYTYTMTLYFAIDGANMETQWDSLLELSNEIADTFRNSFTLDGAVYKAEITHGKAIIQIPKIPTSRPKWIGHRFMLDVEMEES